MSGAKTVEELQERLNILLGVLNSARTLILADFEKTLPNAVAMVCVTNEIFKQASDEYLKKYVDTWLPSIELKIRLPKPEQDNQDTETTKIYHTAWADLAITELKIYTQEIQDIVQDIIQRNTKSNDLDLV